MGSRNKWTPENLAALKAMAAVNTPLAVIAEYFNIGENTANEYIAKLGINRGNILKRKALAMLHKGHKQTEVSKKLRIPQPTLSRWNKQEENDNV